MFGGIPPARLPPKVETGDALRKHTHCRPAGRKFCLYKPNNKGFIRLPKAPRRGEKILGYIEENEAPPGGGGVGGGSSMADTLRNNTQDFQLVDPYAEIHPCAEF